MIKERISKHITPPAPTPHNPPAATGSLTDLLALMARLRQDCPWDKKQDNHSLIPYVIEETYELAEAIQQDDDADIQGELGDVLLQVVFHAQLYAEQGRFDMSDIIATLQQKLIRRHPHVFDKNNLPDDEAVKQRWDEIKAEENAGKPRRRLDAVKAGSPLMQAQNLQQQAAILGFDWEGVDDAIAKLDEEIGELKALLPPTPPSSPSPAAQQALKAEMEKELGDCFFGLVNVARKLDIDAETALLSCIHKFKSRFGYIEDTLASQGKSPETSPLEEMDELWEQAKQQLNRTDPDVDRS